MGLIQNLAAIAIRSKVVGALRAECPAELTEALEQLLADKAAVAAVQGLVAANLKSPAGITESAIMGLDVAADIKELFAATPELVAYLVRTAVGKLTN